MPFPLPKGKPEFRELEESILQYWKEDKTFKKSVESRPAENPYRFYDGPPFISGMPHYGSLLSSIIKDVIPRYQTMLGKRVERVWGWDCHGLPIEQKVQKKLGLESNKEIEESEGGIQNFIDECYNYTRDTSAEWQWYIDHIGRWVDMDHAYRTMDQDYMESVMWVFSQIWEKGYIYEGKRVSWYSWKLGTPISNFEIAMDDSYVDVQDPAITVKFPLKEVKKGAGAIIQDEEGKLLMIKNKKDGLWRFAGGNVEAGESYHAGVARELLEETGITCELTPYCSTYIGYRGEFYEALSFRGTVSSGTKVLIEEDKFSDYEYFAMDTLPVRSEIHRMEYDLIDFLTGVREPVLVPELSEPRKVNILAWTTTPWTIPMHMALAVNQDIQYVAIYHAEEVYILADSRVETVFKGKGEYQVLCTIPGDELVGLTYKAPFDYYQNNKAERINNKEGLENSFKVYHADFVTDTDGTGIAHEAPEFGDVDYQLAKEKGIFITSAIDEAGKYTAEVPDYAGQLYLDCIEPITERLKTEGTLFKKEGITHRVPYCPRSNTPLIQKAQKSWFIDIQRIKSELIAQNEHINWFPEHFKHGRFLKSLESAPDWCISRSRFWGTPMPVWQNSDGSERVVIGSREELYQRNKPLAQITKLVILRHAQSEANEQKIYNDDGLSPLSELGKKQSQELVEQLKKEGVEVIISSPFLRTIQTITPFSEISGIPIETMIELRETEHGVIANQSSDGEAGIRERLSFQADPDHKFGETGESQNDVIHRGKKVLEYISQKYPGKTVAIVSHAYTVKSLRLAAGAKPLPEKVKNAQIYTVYLDNNTGKELNLHRPTIDRIYLPPCGDSSETKQDTTKIVFLRHAQSESNVLKVNDSFGKYTLTELGIQQSQELIEILEKENVTVIYSSPLARAQDTIRPFSKKKGIEITLDEDLREMNHGGLELVAHDKCGEENALYYPQLDHQYAGGESQNQIQNRMFGALQKIIKKHPGETVVIVSHGDPMGILLRHVTGQDYLQDKKISPKRAQPIILSIDNKTGKEILPSSGKKVLGIHGWTSSGIQKGYEGKWLPLEDKLKAVGIEFDVPDFDKNKETTYSLWRKKLDTLDVASYDTIMATSFGCPVIMQYLCEKNMRLKRLVLVAPSGLKGNEYLEKVIPEMTENVEKLRGLVDEIIIPHSEDDDSTSARFEYGKSLAKIIGATFLPINGVGHRFGGWSIDFLSSLIQHGAPLCRIPEVLDVWMDSASMPYAQVHYPFENQEKMEASFPADFIAEYTGQIRAWFYVMHAIGVMVKGSPAFKNVAVTGVINGTDGRKMSKSFGNYPDPRETIEKYGADAIRFYLMSGTLMKGEDMTFSEAGIQESIKRVLLPLWNAYTFFATYANIDGWEYTSFAKGEKKSEENKGDLENPQSSSDSDSSFAKGAYTTPKTHELDTWIISQLHTLIRDMRVYMDNYDLQKSGDAIILFLDGLNNWYIRRNRRRFWRAELDADKRSAYETLHEVLTTMTKLLAPICPFITEFLYGNLTREEQKAEIKKQKEGCDNNNPPLCSVPFALYSGNSVHLQFFPVSNPDLIDEAVNKKMHDLQNLTNLGLAIRGREKLRVRQPLRSASITLDLDESARETLAEELNVKEIHTIGNIADFVTITYSPDAKQIGATERKQWMKTIISDAKSGRGTLLEDGSLQIDCPDAPDGKILLISDEFETIYTPKAGSTIAFAGNAGYVIGLDITLDEELTLEGYARDMIRGIQDARKELGFEVTDRLQLSLSSDNDTLVKILATHQGMIEKETLTTIVDCRLKIVDGRDLELDEGFRISLTLSK